jgi:hypothetical protein
MDLTILGRLLLAIGVAIALLGGLLLLGGRLPFGGLPGDIAVEGSSGGFYFPVVTCLLLSVVLTVILNIVIRH